MSRLLQNYWKITLLLLVLGLVSCSTPQTSPSVLAPVASPSPLVLASQTPTAISTTALPAPQDQEAQPLQIDIVKSYFDYWDNLRVVGLVTNHSDQAVDSIQVEIYAFDSDNQVIHTEVVYTFLNSLNPGETTPFGVAPHVDIPTAVYFSATVVAYHTDQIQRTQLEIINPHLTQDDHGDFHLLGELQNPTDAPVAINGMAGAVFDGENTLLAADDYNVLSRYLMPAGALNEMDRTPFRVSIPGPKDGTAPALDFTLFIDAQQTEPLPPLEISLSELHNYYDNFGTLHLVGEISNLGSQAIDLRLVGGIYTQANRLLDAAMVDIPFAVLPPGEVLPFDMDYWGPLSDNVEAFTEATEYTIQMDPYWSWVIQLDLIDLPISNAAVVYNEEEVEFSGQLVNNTGNALENAVVIIYLRDKETQAVHATSYDLHLERIPDGTSIEYLVYIPLPANFDQDLYEIFSIAKGQLP